MVVWVLIWLQMGVDVQHYRLGQYQTETGCLEEKQKAVMLAPQDNQILHCLKIYIKGM